MSEQGSGAGFGLAQAKQEGASVPFCEGEQESGYASEPTVWIELPMTLAEINRTLDALEFLESETGETDPLPDLREILQEARARIESR